MTNIEEVGAPVTVSAAEVVWFSVRNMWDTMGLVTVSTASVMWLSARIRGI